MVRAKKEACLVRPKSVVPCSKEFRVIGTINPAAIRLPNKNILLYVRVIEKLIVDKDKEYYYSPRFEGKKSYKIIFDKFRKSKVERGTELDFTFKDGTKRLTFISHFRKVLLSPDGFVVRRIDHGPSFYGLVGDGELGVEDPRFTMIGKKYVMTYVALSRKGNVSTSYATSRDLKNWKRHGVIFRQQNKDVVIFPEKIGGKYFAINRPEGTFQFSKPHMLISESRDLDYWGKPKQLVLGGGGAWDSGRVGAGPPPIRTKSGWLLIYHGVLEKGKRSIYSAGAVLLDIKKPWKILAKTKKPVILPTKSYEKGTFEDKDVVFPTGAVLHQNKKDILIFSGGGDINTTVKQFSLEKIFKVMKEV